MREGKEGVFDTLWTGGKEKAIIERNFPFFHSGFQGIFVALSCDVVVILTLEFILRVIPLHRKYKFRAFLCNG